MINGGFSHSRRATLNVSNATFNTEVMSLQTGSELYQGSTDITHYEVITATGTTLTTAFKAIGTAGAEIKFIYKVERNGSYSKTFEQVASAPTTGQFTYTSATKTIAFASADEPTSGDMFAVAYTFKSANNAQVITVSGDGVPSTVQAVAFGLAKDTCTGELFPCQVAGLAQIDGNWSFDLAADGDPVVQNFSMEFVKGCGSNKLYDFKVYTEDEAE